jgi:hypothetical protein
MTWQRSKKKDFFLALLSLAIALSVVMMGLSLGTLRPHIPVYGKNVGQATSIRFKEVTSNLKLDFTHHLHFVGSQIDTSELEKGISSAAPGLAVADYDKDGRMDFFVTQPKPGEPIRLYHNKGTSFENVNESQFASINDNDTAAEVPVWIDINRDGAKDLFVANSGCPRAFLNQGKGDFESLDLTQWPSLCGGGIGSVAVVDFNRDGWEDLIVATNSTPGQPGFSSKAPIYSRGDKRHGGRNILILNDRGTLRPSKIDFLYSSHTQAVGISDINKDGWPDVYFGNDLSTDEFFLNLKGEAIKEVTNEVIPVVEHGYSSMNAEFSDFDDDGHIDLFVSALFKPPFMNSTNLLWKNDGTGHFKNVSKLMGVNKCGFAWSAKNVDFNNDGKKELLVMNGRFKGKDVSLEHRGSSYWYRRMQKVLTPRILRKFKPKNSQAAPSFLNSPGEVTDFSGLERPCLFEFGNDGATDVAPGSGIDIWSPVRSMVVFDYNNDGLLDVLVVEFNGYLRLFENISEREGNWVGLSLEDSENQSTVGTYIRVQMKNSEEKVFEYYPTNGFRGQNDPRIHVGMGNSSPTRVLVRWPDQYEEVFSDIKINNYNNLVRGHGSIVKN